MAISAEKISKPKMWLVVAGVTAVALLLRLYRIDYQSLWFDESFSLLASSAPIASLMRQLIEDFVHPPLHYIALNIVHHVLGLDSYSARTLSAIYGAASIPLVFYAGSIFFSRSAGLLAAVLLAISQLSVMYSQEARPYAQQIFFIAAMLVFLGLAIQRNKSWAWWCAVFAAIFAVYTHYFSVFVIAPLYIWAAFGKHAISWKKLAGGLLIAAALFLPWLFSGIIDAAINSPKTISEQPSWFSVSWTTMVDTINRFNNGGLDGVLIHGPAWVFFVGAFLFSSPVISTIVDRRTSLLTVVWVIGTCLVFALNAATGPSTSGAAVIWLFLARVVLGFCSRSAIAESSFFKLVANPRLWSGLLVMAFLIALRVQSPSWVFFALGIMLGIITHTELLRRETRVSNASASDDDRRDEIACAKQSFIALSASLFLGIAIPIALGAVSIQYDPRYTLATLPIYYILVAEGVTQIRPQVYKYVLVIAMCALSLFALRQNYFSPYKENWRDSLALMINSYQENDCVIMYPFTNVPVSTWYAYGYDEMLPEMRYVPSSRIAEIVPSCPRLWFMQYGRVRAEFELGESMKKQVELHQSVVEAWSFHWIDVFLYTNKSSAH